MSQTQKKLSKAQKIKLNLKEQLGYNQRMVSLRENPCGLSYSFTFTIRDPKVSLQKLSEFVSAKESIDKCEHSGEILSGGNTFVHITMSNEVADNWSRNHIDEISTAAPEQNSYSIYYRLKNGITVHRYHDTPHAFRLIRTSDRLDITCPTTNTRTLSIYLHLLKEMAYDQDIFRSCIRKLEFPFY